jgi:hypothetical protein
MNEPCKHEREAAARWQTTARFDDLDDVVRLRLDLQDARATIERVRALLGDTAGPLWSVRGVREADLRAALEATS